MANKPNADRIFQAIAAILQRRHQVEISYIVEERPPRGLFFSPSCCVNETKNEGVSYEQNCN